MRTTLPGLAVAAALALSGCAAGPEPRPRPSPSPAPAAGAVAQVAAGGAKVAGPPCTAPRPPTGPAAAERSRGIDALLSGRARDAGAAFEKVVRDRPRDMAAGFLYSASVATVARATTGVREELPMPVPLPALPPAYTLRTPAEVPPGFEVVHLEKVSEARNLITDDADWLAKNGLVPRARRPAATDLPEHVARSAGGLVVNRLLSHPDHDVATYGVLLGAFAPGRPPRLFDLSRTVRTSAARQLDVDFAQVVGGVLVIQAAHNGYAKELDGKTGYLAAFKLDTGELLWSSEPLVANADNFLVVGASVVAGYGFTSEPDFLHVVDLRTGKVAQKVPLRSGPSRILTKGDRVFVRTYDTDYVFRAVPGTAAPPAALPVSGAAGASSTVDPDTRCWVDVAVAAIDARNSHALAPAVDALERKRGRDEPLVSVLEAALHFLQQQEQGLRSIDLTTQDVFVLAAPPWDYALFANAPAPATRAPTLVKRSGSAADPVRVVGKRQLGNSGAFSIPPIDRGRLPPGARSDIPTAFGFEALREIIPSGDRLILVYGGRYVAVVRGAETERILDLDAFRHPPRANPQWKEFAVEDVTFAQIQDGVLYVANGGGSYAREVFGKKGFMSAIELASGKLLWRSQPLVAGSTFALSGEFVVSGYGFTDEPDYLYVLRRADGRVVAKASLESAPHLIELRKGLVHVEAYGHAYDFELRP